LSRAPQLAEAVVERHALQPPQLLAHDAPVVSASGGRAGGQLGAASASAAARRATKRHQHTARSAASGPSPTAGTRSPAPLADAVVALLELVCVMTHARAAQGFLGAMPCAGGQLRAGARPRQQGRARSTLSLQGAQPHGHKATPTATHTHTHSHSHSHTHSHTHTATHTASHTQRCSAPMSMPASACSFSGATYRLLQQAPSRTTRCASSPGTSRGAAPWLRLLYSRRGAMGVARNSSWLGKAGSSCSWRVLRWLCAQVLRARVRRVCVCVCVCVCARVTCVWRVCVQGEGVRGQSERAQGRPQAWVLLCAMRPPTAPGTPPTGKPERTRARGQVL
jgi:hypothetical protein